MGANKISNLQKCGEILIDIKTKNRKNKTYIFHCNFCDIQCDQLKKFSLHLGEVHLNTSEDILNETELKFEAEPEEIRIQTLTEIENTDIKKDFGSSIENRTYVNPDPLDTVAPESSVSNNDILNCKIKCELKESSIDGSTVCEKDEMYCGADDIANETNEKLEIFNTNSGDKNFVFDSDSEDEIKDDLDQMPLKKRKLNVVKKAKRLKQKTFKNEMSSDESKDADDNMGKTRAERRREATMRYLAKLKKDPIKYKEYCDKAAARMRRRREELSKLANANSKQLKERREKDRIRQKKLRDRKKKEAKEREKLKTCACNQTLGKAVIKIEYDIAVLNESS